MSAPSTADVQPYALTANDTMYAGMAFTAILSERYSDAREALRHLGLDALCEVAVHLGVLDGLADAEVRARMAHRGYTVIPEPALVVPCGRCGHDEAAHFSNLGRRACEACGTGRCDPARVPVIA